MLPIAVALKELHPNLEILCLYPNPGSVIGARPGWTPIQMLEELGATSAYPITSVRWMPSNRLTLRGEISKFVAKASRLTYSHLYPMGRTYRALVSAALLILAWLSHHQISRKIENITRGSNFVIWDARMLKKEYMNPIMYLLRDVPSYSINHGMGRQTNPEAANQNWKDTDRSISERLTIFAMSLHEIADYKKITGVEAEQIKAAGIYRHHPDWIRTITSQAPGKGGTADKDSILIISRGYGSTMPRERMLRYVEDIKTAAEELNLRVMVKPHPKETDLGVYAEVFRSASKGLIWEVSDIHIAILAKRASFAVCFFSGACIDLTAYGVPTIERLNLIGLPEYDVPSAIRDPAGAPILQYRHDGHVLGSSTSEEFFLRVEEVMRDRQKVMRKLRLAYARQFVSPPMSPKELAQQISDAWLGFSELQSGTSQ